MLLIRSLIFAILIPGIVVRVVPYLIAGADARSRRRYVISDVALALPSIGVLVLAACIRDLLLPRASSSPVAMGAVPAAVSNVVQRRRVRVETLQMLTESL